MKLQELGNEIWNCNKCPFNEKTDARYCGGFGEDHRVMFVAESPSTSGGKGKFPADKNFGAIGASKLFREVRKKYGLEKCYLTDFVKCGIPNGKPTKQKIDNCVGYLNEEIKIVKPKVIVGVGKDAYKMLKANLNTDIPIVFTYHYSHMLRWCKNKPDKMLEYENQHKEIAEFL